MAGARGPPEGWRQVQTCPRGQYRRTGSLGVRDEHAAWPDEVQGLLEVRGAQAGEVARDSGDSQPPIVLPEKVRAGVRVDRLGERSVTWGLAIFDEHQDEACAHGQMVHVFVDRQTRRPVAIPAALRRELQTLEATAVG